MAKDQEEAGNERSQVWGAICVFVLVVIALLAGWLAFTRPKAPASHAAQGASPPGTTAAAVTGCHPSDAQQSLAAPADVIWRLYQGQALPYSSSVGPLVSDGPVESCYAHSPGGALLAAIQIPAHFDLAGTGNETKVVLAQFAPGVGRDAFVRRLQQVIAAAPPGQPGSVPNQVAAFKFVSYTPAAAVVATVYRSQNGGLSVSEVTVVWQDGDWKLAVQPDGSAEPPLAAVSTIAGFTEFRGE
jgi:hypothetical protein